MTRNKALDDMQRLIDGLRKEITDKERLIRDWEDTPSFYDRVWDAEVARRTLKAAQAIACGTYDAIEHSLFGNFQEALMPYIWSLGFGSEDTERYNEIARLTHERAFMRSRKPGTSGPVRYGNMERHILEVINMHYRDVGEVALDALAGHCEVTLPEPEAGKRDIRRQTVLRAMMSLSKRHEGPIRIESGRVKIF